MRPGIEVKNKFQFTKDVSVFTSFSASTRPHLHHAFEIVVSQQIFSVVIGERRLRVRGVLIRPDIVHSIGSKSLTISIYFEAHSNLGRAVLQSLGGRQTIQLRGTQIREILDFFKLPITAGESMPFLETKLIGKVLMASSSNNIDLRIKRVMDYIDQTFVKKTDFATIRTIACLSESRLIHLFKMEVGIPIRNYITWRRLQEVIRLVGDGHNLSTAAHKGGFTDAAHLNRAFVAAFGLNPSAVLRK